MRSGSTSAAESLGVKSFQTSGCSAGMMQSEAVIMITLRMLPPAKVWLLVLKV